MRSRSPQYGRRLTKSVNIQRKNKEHQNSKSIAYNIHQFNFDLPSCSLLVPNNTSNISFIPQEPLKTNPQIHFDDSRREQIKQKIKFRVKQQMWNLIKKNYQYPIIQESQPITESKRVVNIESTRVCVKGASFTRLQQQDFSFRKNSQYSESKKNSKGYQTYGSKAKQSEKMQKFKHLRVWSSFVKIKQKDRLQMRKTSYKAASSVINIQKLDSYKIEPWKGFQDAQNLMVDR